MFANNFSINDNSTPPTIFSSSLSHKLIGIAYLTISIAFLIIYLMVLYIMNEDKSNHKRSYHKIVMNLGIADVAQLFFNGIPTGLMNITEKSIFSINKFAGASIMASWWAFCLLVHLLALNRFVHVVLNHKVPIFFSNRLIKLYLCVIWTYCFACFVLALTPNVTMSYRIENYAWDLENSKTDECLICGFDQLTTLCNNLAAVIWYIIIYFYLKINVSHKNYRWRK